MRDDYRSRGNVALLLIRSREAARSLSSGRLGEAGLPNNVKGTRKSHLLDRLVRGGIDDGKVLAMKRWIRTEDQTP